MSGNDIHTYHFHCPGMLTVICPGTDVLPIGGLPAGLYNVTANLFQGAYDSLDNCSSYTQIDAANFQFTVSIIIGIDYITKVKPIVFLNKEKIKISNLISEYQFVLFDVTGKEVLSRKVSATDNDFSISVEAGIYFYSIRANGTQEFTGKIIVNEQ